MKNLMQMLIIGFFLLAVTVFGQEEIRTVNLTYSALTGINQGQSVIGRDSSDILKVDDMKWSGPHKSVVLFSQEVGAGENEIRPDQLNVEELELAIKDLVKTFPERYAKGHEYLAGIEEWKKQIPDILKGLEQNDKASEKKALKFMKFRREALLANPLLDFDSLLLIKRKPLGDPRLSKAHRGLGGLMGIPQQSSFQLTRIQDPLKYENEIMVMTDLRGQRTLNTLFKPAKTRLLSGLELHFDAEKLLFGMPGDDDLHWQVFEVGTDGTNLQQVSSSPLDGIHNFDPCYLPDEKIVYLSTAAFQGVPCNPTVQVAMSYVMDADGSNVRQLTFDQDHNFNPTLMNDGRVMYLRWEYTDIPHAFGRYIFSMNPDGTTQRAIYGSGSYWPNALFCARPIPYHSSRFVGIVTGHHEGRDGEMMIFDPTLARSSPSAVVQQIPFRGKTVKDEIKDKLTEDRFPRFIHPFPLSDPESAAGAGKYFITTCKPTPNDLWGIYLVDVFDNLLLLKEIEGHALYEPIPVQKRKRPPVIPDKVDLKRKDATIYIENIYEGPGLKGIPKGSVKNLRLITYNFGYNKVVFYNDHPTGTSGPWEPKRIMGTVPVHPDGSALFSVPANMPVSIQPLDSVGRALQLMRSWTTAMPGEFVSCVGCHENLNDAPLNRGRTTALKNAPSEIKLWHGQLRGFSFKNEVQPVLDKYCVSCHNGSEAKGNQLLPDLRDAETQNRYVTYVKTDPQLQYVYNTTKEKLLEESVAVFDPSFVELRRRVRVGGLESDLRLQAPGEFFANSSELVQMLEKGHHGVELDQEAWDRLYTWIDLNAPFHGSWTQMAGGAKIAKDHSNRMKMRELYGNIVEDPEADSKIKKVNVVPIKPKKVPPSEHMTPELKGWPLLSQSILKTKDLDLGNGIKLPLVYVPAGKFIMGDPNSYPDELPCVVEIIKPFWISKYEITNKQFRLFDPSHDSRFEHSGTMNFTEYDLGPVLNKPEQPVVRVSWEQALKFCQWLSEQTKEETSLPSESQWEWACRAGADTDFSYGGIDDDFSPFANMADTSIRKLVERGRFGAPDMIPRDNRFDDGFVVTAEVGTYQPNAWGIHDMHGNAWEWTLSRYEAYPYHDDERNNILESGNRVVRGGSWSDRPGRCRSAFRLSYAEWQKVYNVGFRIVLEVDEKD